MSKKTLQRTAVVIAMIAGSSFGIWQWRQSQVSALPEGIAHGNGRLEARQVDVSTKYAGRVAEILVKEGDMVSIGQVLARMDTTELQAQLMKAIASVAEAEGAIPQTEAMIAQRQSALKLAEYEFTRISQLMQGASASSSEFAQKQSERDSAEATVQEAKARLATAKSSVAVAQASVRLIQTQLDDCVLKSPVHGRVLYRLAEPGEMLVAGGKTLTLVDLSDVYMEIFLPARDAARLSIGSEARLTFDAATTEFAVPAVVSFVSPEAQFTPKQVETLDEREKLMFRVRIRIPSELVQRYIEKVKTGVRGVGYVRTDNAVPWPAFLEKRYLGDSS